MQLRFENGYSSEISVAVMWYSPDTCGGDGNNWETRGWWNVQPGDTVHTNVYTSDRYFLFYAEATDGAVWAGNGDYPAQVTTQAFDSCYGTAKQVDVDPSPYFWIAMYLEDAGWWTWIYSSYTVVLQQ